MPKAIITISPEIRNFFFIIVRKRALVKTDHEIFVKKTGGSFCAYLTNFAARGGTRRTGGAYDDMTARLRAGRGVGMQWFLSLPVWARALAASLAMYAMTALGASFVLFSRSPKQHSLTLLTGASAGIMIAASFFSLLLPAVEAVGPLPAWLPVTFGFLAGGVFLVLSDLILSRTQRTMRAIGDRRTALLYFAVTLHNIPEGMAVGVAIAAGAADGAALSALLLALGIAVQNFPEGMCVAFPLRAKGLSPVRSFLFAQGSGAVEVPACVAGALAAGAIGWLMPWALAFSAGAMTAVVCSELIPACFSGNRTLASAGVVLGFCAMMALDLALG